MVVLGNLLKKRLRGPRKAWQRPCCATDVDSILEALGTSFPTQDSTGQHSPEETVIKIAVTDEETSVELPIENKADHLSPTKLDGLFDPLRRQASKTSGVPSNPGLRLLVVREIA